MTTMLSLMQQVSVEMGLASPGFVAANQTTDVVQTLALMNAVGYEVQREHQWQAMTKAYRFTTQFLTTTGTWTASAATVTAIPTTAALAANTWYASGNGIPQDTFIQSVDSGVQVTLSQTPTAAGTAATITFAQLAYSMPTDYDRQVDRTQWDKSKHWEMLGPETAQQWEWLKSGYISTGPRIRYRILGNYFQIWPLQATNEYLGFEYVSKNWVTAAATTTGPDKTAFTVDTDTCIFPDRLMVLGTKKKYFEIKGFDTQALDRDYRAQLDLAKSNEAASPTLSFMPRPLGALIDWSNIPDSGFGA